MSQNILNRPNDMSSNEINYNHGELGSITNILDIDNDGELNINDLVESLRLQQGLPTKSDTINYPDVPTKLLSVGDAKIPASLYINKDLNVVGKIIYNGKELVIDDLKVQPYSLTNKDISDNAKIDISKINLEVISPLKLDNNRITLEISEIPKLPKNKLPDKIPLKNLPRIPITNTDLRGGNNVDICYNKINIPDTIIADKGIESKHFGENTIKNIHISENPIDKINISKTNLQAGNNIELSGNTLNVPDTLVGNGAIKSIHISKNAITNTHISGDIDISKINLSAGNNITLTSNGVLDVPDTLVADNSIENKHISNNSKIDISKTSLLLGDNLEWEQDKNTLKVKDVYVKKNKKGDVYISGNLNVQGETTLVYSSTMAVTDKNIELGNTTNPTDVLAVGGGITLKGTTDKKITWNADM